MGREVAPFVVGQTSVLGGNDALISELQSVLINREIESNTKNTPKILLYITEICAVHISNNKCAQFKFM